MFLLILLDAMMVATFYMIAPDHWLPITIISNKYGFSSAKKYSIASSIAAIHGALSSAIAVAVLYVGLFFLKKFVQDITFAGLLLLIIIGVYFVVNGYIERNRSSIAGHASLAVSVLPDFAIIPLLLTGSTLSSQQIGVIVAVFILVGVATLLAVVAAASLIADFALKKVNPAYFDYLVGFLLFFTAVFVYF